MVQRPTDTNTSRLRKGGRRGTIIAASIIIMSVAIGACATTGYYPYYGGPSVGVHVGVHHHDGYQHRHRYRERHHRHR